MSPKELGAILKKHRISLKLSQKEFCKLVNKSKTVYGEIERGNVNLPVEGWNALFKMLGLKPLEHGIVITPVVKNREHLSKWWRWPLAYIIWDGIFFGFTGDEIIDPWPVLTMVFIFACAPIAILWWYWPAPWPFTKARREKIRNWRLWSILTQSRYKIIEKYNLWLP